MLANSGREKLFVKRNVLSFVSCYAIFSSIKSHGGREQLVTVSERKAPFYKFDVSKVLCPDIGKITNRPSTAGNMAEARPRYGVQS